MLLGELGLRNLAFTQKRKDFFGVRVGNTSGYRVQRLRGGETAVVMLVFWECLHGIGLARMRRDEL
jgi:hypothetical protein